MRLRSVLLGSLGLNLLLALALAWAAAHRRSAPATDAGPALTGHRLVRLRPPGPRVPPPTVVEVAGRFDWSELESPDLAVYVANLRAIGCPERTIRDLVVAEVDELLQARVRAIVDPVQGRFWELILSKAKLEPVVEAKWEELKALEKERERIFRQLLGTGDPEYDFAQEVAEAERHREQARLLDFLPAEKEQALVALEAQYQALRAAVIAEGQTVTPEARAERASRLTQLRLEEQAARDQLLTPAEVEELELRRFGAGRNTRFAYGSVPLTPEETRALTALERTQSLAGAGLPVNSSARQAAVTATKQAVAEQRRQLLGETRLAEWQRSQQPDYALVNRLTERLNLPAETLHQVLDTRTQLQAGARAIRQDTQLDAAQRQAALAALEAQARATLLGTLGETGYEAYRRNSSGWQEDLQLPPLPTGQ